ncbi:TetR family transcriptional regulator [Amnibacterium sp.]|uniref:TetR family transcriptional regulator n=1 Tax=Amnibacterium sp. TaxID=1872496 RepID=UPI003F7BE700
MTEGEPTDLDRASRTRARILQAARAEFAAAGFGGGRVERIAARAGSNKERIYAYFGDKRSLFAAAVASAVEELGGVAVAGPDGLGGWAERLFDFMAAHPDTLRLLRWAHLESDAPAEEADERLAELPRPEDAVARWQQQGLVSARWDPHDLVVLVLGLCEVFHTPPYRPGEPGAAAVDARRRALVRHAVSLLAEPAR